MAVNRTETSSGASGRRMLVGTNVLVATLLALAIVVVAQLIAYKSHRRWDLTSTGVNSLSDASEGLLRGLDQNLRVTSLYFETDREDEDQSGYRRTVNDLLSLYEATNRSKIRADRVNPLKDHEQFNDLLARLRSKTAFSGDIAAYQTHLDKYADDLATQMRTLVETELAQVKALSTAIGPGGADVVLGPVEQAFAELSGHLDAAREQFDALTVAASPQYGAATQLLVGLYGRVSGTLANVGKYGAGQVGAGVPPDQAKFLSEAGQRYTEIVAAIEGEKTAMGALEPLSFEDMASQLAPTANAIVIETDDDARVVDFDTLWPVIQQGSGGRAGLKDRAFKGEEKLTSAILRVTHKEQTAVVFVRYGGGPMFGAGMPMMRQRPGPYVQIKQQLEDANFVVEEWDLKGGTGPPTIEPTPTRTIYVVFKPSPPQQGPMGQPTGDASFGPMHLRALTDAIGDSGQALFIAGWHPGPMGPIPGPYEFNDYLTERWGITVETDMLLVQTINIAPDKYVVQTGFHVMRNVAVSDHDIVSGPLARELGLPVVSPLSLADAPPEGVELSRLVSIPAKDGIWGERNLQGFITSAQSREPFAPDADDQPGPFDVAVAATKGDAKVVVISSADFAMDGVALAAGIVMTQRGVQLRAQNPGNVPLLTNSLHWLSDNTEFMNIGTPIESSVLRIEGESTVKWVRVLTIFAWPVMAILGGGMVWWTRRR